MGARTGPRPPLGPAQAFEPRCEDQGLPLIAAEWAGDSSGAAADLLELHAAVSSSVFVSGEGLDEQTVGIKLFYLAAMPKLRHAGGSGFLRCSRRTRSSPIKLMMPAESGGSSCLI